MTTMCYHPWVGLDISPQGEFKPCCKYQTTIADNFNDYKNSSELLELQNNFLQGIKPQGCKRCWDDEDAGLASKRQLDYQHIFNNTAPDTTALKVLSLPFGNSCNLACRICGSYSSSTWIAESKKLQEHFPNIKIYSHKRFYQDAQFMEQVKNISSKIIHVEFPGGEPFLAGTDEHLNFLDFLTELDPSEISLHYMTNTTVYPSEEYWTRWQKFKKVDIQLSIDGLGAQFEYNRWPAKWIDCQSNVARYIEQRSTMKNLQLSVSHSVSTFTVFYLPEFLKWCLQNKLGKPYLGMVAEPKMYNIKCLPTPIKKIVEDKISSFNLKDVVQYMYSEDFSNEFAAGIELTKVLDQQRNQSFINTFSEFYQLVKESYV